MTCRRTARTGHALAMLLAVGTFSLLAGCSGKAESSLEDYLEELEFESPLQSIQEIDLGLFRISSAARMNNQPEHDEKPQWVQIKFKLSVATSPEDEEVVVAATERHRGMLDDAILCVCRSASIRELDGNRWAAIKARMIDRIRPILGEHRVRQITFDDFGWEPI